MNYNGFVILRRIMFLFIIQFGFYFYVTAQDEPQPVINSILDGVILDSIDKHPLDGATVNIKGTTNQTSTDKKGKFRLRTGQTIPCILVVSFVGYKAKELEVTDTLSLRITLEPINQDLSEVVVVGYGTQKKSDVTGAVASVPSVVKDQPVSSVERLLQGSVAGVQVTQTSGQPGGGTSIQIRGNNSINAGSNPLYVIDGFPVNTDYGLVDAGVNTGSAINPLSTINPTDIENIDVLKDASATAIYGSRGANGVVIITTKKGAKNKNSFTYDTYYGIQEVTKTLPVLNAAQWWQLRKDAAANSGKTASLPTTSGYALDTTGVGTDWQSAAFRKAPIQSHSLSLMMGTAKTRLALSLSYFDQQGILQNTDFKRFSGRLNVEHDYSDKFHISTSMIVSRSKANIAPTAVVGNILLTPPSLPIYDDAGAFILYSPFESSLQNPINSLYNQLNENNINRFLGNVAAEYKLTNDLKAKVLIGADVVDTKQNRYLLKLLLKAWTCRVLLK
ncbi:SusC/RagA family TonB-linked outer membrane protein [Niabella ginsengisoli]|uniref:SusC/RagA family TonB-linked outer membrane protein n=1 Tax=Niabella ginsengisoli TaxID=522298 RepID=UPI0021D422EE|nr:SusC/RagA family TonB-linked outer membrane protein [Niabella ginsengisoli]